MKITTAYIERTYNLGNYESLKIGFDAVLSDSDQPLQVTQDLELLANQHFENRTKPKAEAPKSPMQLANEKQAVREAAAKPSEMFKDETLKNVLADINGDMRPIHYISDSALFGRISDDLKAHGFKWVSAGKESRWTRQ